MTRRKIIWYPSALHDLEAIDDYLRSAGSSLSADRVMDRIEKVVASLRLTANRGRVVAEFASLGLTAYREVIETPWRIVYRVDAHEVFILTVVDSRRQLDELLVERLIRAT